MVISEVNTNLFIVNKTSVIFVHAFITKRSEIKFGSGYGTKQLYEMSISYDFFLV